MTTENNTFITPKELANELNSDPKTVRKFLRSLSDERPGKGGRWAIPASMLPEISDRFADWNSHSATVFSIDAADEDETDEV